MYSGREPCLKDPTVAEAEAGADALAAKVPPLWAIPAWRCCRDKDDPKSWLVIPNQSLSYLALKENKEPSFPK